MVMSEEQKTEDEESNEIQKTTQKLVEELDKEKKRADDYFKRLQYLQADFENYTKFLNVLNKEGVQSIPALGTDFDPSVHEVVGSVPVETSMVGKVVEEVRKGFMFEGKVLRPSAVKIGVKEVDVI